MLRQDAGDRGRSLAWLLLGPLAAAGIPRATSRSSPAARPASSMRNRPGVARASVARRPTETVARQVLAVPGGAAGHAARVGLPARLRARGPAARRVLRSCRSCSSPPSCRVARSRPSAGSRCSAFPLVWILASRRSVVRAPRVADRVGRAVHDRRDPVVRWVLGPVTDPATLTVVLPAYNEAERIGPALDELFEYLRRRDDRARDGAPGAGGLPDTIDVLVVDDGSDRRHGGDRRGAAGGTRRGDRRRDAVDCASCGWRTAARAPPCGPACWRRRATSSSSPMPTWRRRPISSRCSSRALDEHDVALGSRIQPDGSDMRATQPGYRRLLGRAFHLLASLWVVGPVQDTQCGFKGFRRAAAQDLFARQRVTSIVFDVELIYLARRRAATGSPSCRSAGSTSAGRGCGRDRRSRCASRGTCSGSRSSTGAAVGAPRNAGD